MKKLLSFLLSLLLCLPAAAQSPAYSAAMIKSHGRQWTEYMAWDYVSGLVAKSILMYCAQYPDDALASEAYSWCKTYADNAVDSEGNFYNFKRGSLDNIASGKILCDLYTHELKENPAGAERYSLAADFLYDYLRYDYTRITSAEGKGGFIHKDSYPDQMWLDGLYMGAAFYAEYLACFAPGDSEAWSDIALQFFIIHDHTYDPEKQLNYHAWSANPRDMNSFWARTSDPFKGCSREFWGRAMGWYAAALVDVLALMPQDHPDYRDLADIFSEVAAGIRRWQDPGGHVWYQLLQYDNSFVSARGNHNYLEASVSSMFTYALFKGIRLGLLDYGEFAPVALNAYAGLLDTFITESSAGVDINNICRSAGLGPFYNRERDGSANYYLDGSDVNIVSNEGKGIGSFIMASLEYEKHVNSSLQSPTYDTDAPVEYFDLMGRRYASPPKGVYIELSHGKATKKISHR